MVLDTLYLEWWRGEENFIFFFQAEGDIRDLVRSRGLGDVYKRQGVYRGLKRPSSLVAKLRAHAPEYVQAGGKWYITSAGWPWAATITSGEAAVAELELSLIQI